MAKGTQAASGSKAGDRITLPDGSTGRITQGNHIRLDNGKLYQGDLGGAATSTAPTNAPGILPGTNISPSSPLPRPFGGSVIGNDQPYKTPGQIYNAQEAANQQNISQQLNVNRLGEISPYGSLQYVQGPNGEQIKVQTIGNQNPLTAAAWQGEQFQNQSYIDRALQAIAGEGGANNQGQAGLLPQLRGMFSSGLDFSNLSPAPNANNFGADRASAEKSLYDAFSQRNEPLFKQQSEELQQQLANRGIPIGSDLYNRTMESLGRQQSDARLQANAQATQFGQNEQNMLFNNALQARNQGIGEAQTLRNQPLTDLRGLLSAVNPLQLPQFNQTANVNVPTNNFAGTADNFLTRNSNADLAKAGFANQLALANLNNEAASQMQQAGFQNQQALQQQQQNFLAGQNNNSGSSFLGQLGGGFLGGLFGGVGNSFGQSIGGWFG